MPARKRKKNGRFKAGSVNEVVVGPSEHVLRIPTVFYIALPTGDDRAVAAAAFLAGGQILAEAPTEALPAFVGRLRNTAKQVAHQVKNAREAKNTRLVKQILKTERPEVLPRELFVDLKQAMDDVVDEKQLQLEENERLQAFVAELEDEDSDWCESDDSDDDYEGRVVTETVGGKRVRPPHRASVDLTSAARSRRFRTIVESTNDVLDANCRRPRENTKDCVWC